MKMAIFTNQAILSYRNGTVSSNVVTGEILEVLSATKNALVDTYSAGDVLTYVISLLNTGDTAISGATVTDDLGAYPFGTSTLVPLTYIDGSVAYYINGILQADPTVTSGTELVFSGITVPAGGNATLIYQARANEFAPLGVDGSVTNTAVLEGTGVCGEVAATETVTTTDGPALGITKSIFPTSVSGSGTLTYTFTVQNFGNTAAVATDDLVISDSFDPILNPITVTYNGTIWTEGTEYNYDPTTGAFSTIAGYITVPAATYFQDPTTGAWNVLPGETTITVTGTVVCNN